MATCILHISSAHTRSIVPLDFTSKIHSQRLRMARQQQQSTKWSMGWRHRLHTREPSPVYILHFIKVPSFFQNSRRNFLDFHVKGEIHSISQTVFPYFALFSPSFIFASLTLGFALETSKSFQYFLKLYSAIPIPTSHPKFCPARTQSLVEGVPSYPYHSSNVPAIMFPHWLNYLPKRDLAVTCQFSSIYYLVISMQTYFPLLNIFENVVTT